MKSNIGRGNGFQLRMNCETARQIRQHARSSMKAEVCGVLIGSEDGASTVVQASIPGAKAVQAGTHVTFTQDTWEHIYQIKDRDFPDARIMGWYHSHPGFGVFLSDHDTFIHENFFSSPGQVAWVYDPHSDEEGCFGWVGEKLTRLDQIVIMDDKGGEAAGETGKPEPLLAENDEREPDAREPYKRSERESAAELLWRGLKYFTIFVAGFLLSWFIFPRLIVVPVDPHTGQPILSVQPNPPVTPSAVKPETNIGSKPAPQPAKSIPPPPNADAKGKP